MPQQRLGRPEVPAKWRLFGRYLFVWQTLFIYVLSTVVLIVVLDNRAVARWGRFNAIKEEVARSADTPINSMLAFTFGLVVGRSMIRAAAIRAAVINADDLRWTICWVLKKQTAAESSDSVASKKKTNFESSDAESVKQELYEYRTNIVHYLGAVRDLASDYFADQVLISGFKQLHRACTGRKKESLDEATNAIRKLQDNDMDKFKSLYKGAYKELHIPFHGYPMSTPLSKVYQLAVTSDSCSETRFALIALAVSSVISRNVVSGSNYAATFGWAFILFCVVLWPYAQLTSFIYKKRLWKISEGPGLSDDTFSWGFPASEKHTFRILHQ